MHRFFLPPESIHGDHVSIPAEQARQIRSVLRLRPDDQILVLDNSSMEYSVRLRSPTEGVIEERHRNEAEPSLQLTLYQGLLKGPKFELVLQKGTEIGITRFVPVTTERSVAGEPGESKQRRYEAIVREAAEQSGRGKLPDLSPALSLREALDAAEARLIVPWEGEEQASLTGLEFQPNDCVSLFIGPEGGFSDAEIVAARNAGAEIVTLGRRILRAETAALVAATLILARSGDLGGRVGSSGRRQLTDL